MSLRFGAVVLSAAALFASSSHAGAADLATPKPVDRERTAFLVGSTIAFSAGTLGSLAGWAIAGTDCASLLSPPPKCDRASEQIWLMSYAAHLVVAPSVPRFAAGDATRGLLFTSARAALLATAFWIAPRGTGGSWASVGLGFVAPAALGVWDLATTPHRETTSARVTGLSPVALRDGALLSLGGVW